MEQAELLRQKRAEHEGGHVVWRLFPRIFTKQVGPPNDLSQASFYIETPPPPPGGWMGLGPGPEARLWVSALCAKIGKCPWTA